MLSKAAEERLRQAAGGVNSLAPALAKETNVERRRRLEEERESRLVRAGLASQKPKGHNSSSSSAKSGACKASSERLRGDENSSLLDNTGRPARRASAPEQGGAPAAPLNLGQVLSHGMRLALSQDALQPRRSTRPTDFSQEVEHRPYLELPNGKAIQFRFTDWCPVVFRNLRETQHISHDAFMASVGETALKGGHEGSGKSGAIFFKSQDAQFVVKEVRRSERETLLRILPSYVDFVRAHPHSLLPRFLGLYSIDAVPDVVSQGVTVVVMRNVLNFGAASDAEAEAQFREVYDLKGSVHNRFTSSPQAEFTKRRPRKLSAEVCATFEPSPRGLPRSNSSPVNATPTTTSAQTQAAAQHPQRADLAAVPRRGSTGNPQIIAQAAGPAASAPEPCVLKDLNLRNKFALGERRREVLMRQLHLDVEWLEKHNLMDYSLLLGVASSDPSISSLGSSGASDSDATSESQQRDHLATGPDTDAPIPFDAETMDGAESDTCSEASGLYPGFAPGEEDSFDEDEVSSELGAILRRNNMQRRESAALIPEGGYVKSIKVVGHGQAKRSRESSTVFRSNCTVYTFVVARSDSLGGCSSANSSPRTDPGAPTFADSPSRGARQWVIFRRYKDFEKLQRGLQEELKSANSAHRLPALPKKQMIGFMDPNFVRKREHELERWIQSILALVGNRIDSPVLHGFLTLKANKCPPKWRAQDGLRHLAHRRASATACLGDNDSPGGSPMMGARRVGSPAPRLAPPRHPRSSSFSSTLSSTPAGCLEPLPAFDATLDPRAPESLPLWDTLGGETHQDIAAVRVAVGGQPGAVAHEVRLYLGIIDILQEFNLSKKLESVFKGLTQHADGISAIDPERYGVRFTSFVDEFVLE